MPISRPLARDLRFAQLVELVADLPVADQLAVDRQPAGVDLLEVVDAAQEGGLARAGRSEQAQHLAGLDGQIDAAQHLVAAEALVHPFGLDHRLAHLAPSSWRANRPRRIRCSGVSACSRRAPRP